ncbi:MAG TPA: response regulator transcription factor [Polyangiaceae bacterium]
MIKVLIADDHPVVRLGLRQILADSRDIHVGRDVSSADEVLGAVREERWDVVVLDISLRDGNGIELIGEIRKVRPETRVLILTVHPEEQYAVRAIKAGASGFLNKESAPDRLTDALHKIAEGGRYVSAELAETLASLVAGEAHGQPHERLSDREFEILKLLASGKTVSQAALELGLSVKTISTHRTRILKKMDMKTNAELTHYAVKRGLVS